MSTVSDRSSQLLPGLLSVAAGIGILLVVHLDPSNAQAPLWVVDAAAMTFVFAGISVLANAFGLPLLSRLSGAAVAWVLAVPGLWMLFDGQGAQCSVSVSTVGLSAASGAASGLCRAVFGIGGLMTLAIAVLFTWLALKPLLATKVKTPDAAPSKP